MNTRHPTHGIGTLVLISLCVWLGWQAPAALAAESGVHGRVMGHDESGKFTGLVGGAQIEIKNQAGQRVTATRSTPAGYYRLVVAPGQYFYKVSAPGYKTEDEGRGFRVEKSDALQIFHFALIKGSDDPSAKPPVLPETKIGSLHGAVLERTDQGDVGIPHAVITLRKEGTRQLVRVTSKVGEKDGSGAGQYKVTLETGLWRASVKARGFDVFVDPERIEITAGRETKRDFVLTGEQVVQSEQGLRGVIRFAKLDKPAEKLPPVDVTVVQLPSGRDAGEVSLGAKREFQQKLPAGRYRVVAQAEGFETARSAPLHVFPDRFTHVSLLLRAADSEPVTPPTELSLSVRVTDLRSKQPLAAAKILVRELGKSLADAMRGSTNTEGAATFPVADEREYVAMATLPGYKPGGTRLKISQQGPNRADIGLVKTSEPTTDPEPVSNGKLDVYVSVVESGKNRPLPAASVLLRREGQALQDAVRGVTGADGQLKLRVERAGDYIAMARSSGYRAGGVKMRVGLTSTNKAVISLTLKSETPVSRPVDVTGAVVYEAPPGRLGFALVEGAAMQWRSLEPASPLTRNATSVASGRYRISLPEGVYEVKIKPPSSDFLPLTEKVNVHRGMGVKDFRLRRVGRPQPTTPQVRVAGLVLSKSDGRTGVPLTWLEWQRDGALRIKESVQTSRTGGYTLELPEGDYVVTVRPPRGFQGVKEKVRVHRGMSKKVFYVAKGVSPVPPVTPDQMATLAGYVWGAKPSSRMRVPLPGAEVTFIREMKVSKATTDKRGAFSIRLPVSGYRVIAKAPGYGDLDTKLSVRPGMRPVNLVLNAKASPRPSKLTVQLRILEQKILLNRRRVTAPLPDAAIMFLQKGRVVASGRSGRDGSYQTTLPAGSYDIKVTKQGYVPSAQPLSLSSTAARRDIVLRRTSGTETRPTSGKSVLMLRVVAAKGMPGRRPQMAGVPQADVIVMRGNSRVAVGRTDGNGYYRVPLERGSYMIKVSGKSIRPAGAMVSIESKDVSRQVTVQRVAAPPPSRPRLRLPGRAPPP